MVFANLLFIYAFLPICLIIYLCTNGINAKNNVLLVFSLIFYAWGEPKWIFLLLLSSAITYVGAIVMENNKKDPVKRKTALTVTLILSFAILFIFKYMGFFTENVNVLFKSNLPIAKFILPIGISFYTFQTVSYVIDCYWGKIKPQYDFSKYLLYVSLFPQLVAGPIVRYEAIATEIESRKITSDDWTYGLGRIILGLSKKVIIANNLSTIVNQIFGSNIADVPVMGIWLGSALFALQVYFDFSGYSDMAIGMGRLFGFHINENFNHPFICKDIQEFWQRWHISLGTFFRDYLLYMPIFGKRRKYGGLILVWFATGLWHGASWNFIIWGMFFGIFIMIETYLGKKKIKKIPIYARHIYTKIILTIGFGIFYFEDNTELMQFFKGLIGLNGNKFGDTILNTLLLNNIFLIITAIIFSTPIPDKLKEKIVSTETGETAYGICKIIASTALLLISSVLLVGATNNAFLYYRF